MLNLYKKKTMIFTYDKKTKEIEVCKRTDFSTHAILERQHLEKWIETNPEILGEDVLIITNEYDKFDKTNERLDLLAIDKEGTIVIIELKRDDSGKSVDLQAIKYAAYCSTLTLETTSIIYKDYLEKSIPGISNEDARKKIVGFISNSDFEEINDKPRIILVSKEFRPEVTASVLWLRKFNLDIKCIKFSPYEVSIDKIGIEVNTIIPLPEAEDYIIQTERKESQEGKISVTRQEYLDFYNEIIKDLSSKISKALKPPDPRGYYQIPTGISGTHFEWGFHGRPRTSFGVELHCERSDSNFNKDIVKKLAVHQPILQKRTSENVIIQENWGQKWARIYMEYPHGEINDELKKWAVEKMEVLINILQPEIDKLKV
jgi:hypothetical protein